MSLATSSIATQSPPSSSGPVPVFDEQSLPRLDAYAVLEWTRLTFGDDVILTSSFGAESALMLHLVSEVIPNVRVVFIDTGYLFPETYRFARELANRFRIDLRTYRPQISTAALEAEYGKLWEGDAEDLKLYAQITKVEPMDRALKELRPKAWIAGLRADQTQFRAGLQKVDTSASITKISPILDWTRQDIARYMKQHALPFHPLVEQGYRSIGDHHSTFPVGADANPRDGRRLGHGTECGIHLMK